MLSFELKVHNAMLFYNLSPYLAHIFIKDHETLLNFSQKL